MKKLLVVTVLLVLATSCTSLNKSVTTIHESGEIVTLRKADTITFAFLEVLSDSLNKNGCQWEKVPTTPEELTEQLRSRYKK
jgi:uncharacterized protein (DUF697 family)